MNTGHQDPGQPAASAGGSARDRAPGAAAAARRRPGWPPGRPAVQHTNTHTNTNTADLVDQLLQDPRAGPHLVRLPAARSRRRRMLLTHQKRRCDARAARRSPGRPARAARSRAPCAGHRGLPEGRLGMGSTMAHPPDFGGPLRACGPCRGRCSDAPGVLGSRPAAAGLQADSGQTILMRIDARAGAFSPPGGRLGRDEGWKSGHRQNFVDSWIGPFLTVSR